MVILSIALLHQLKCIIWLSGSIIEFFGTPYNNEIESLNVIERYRTYSYITRTTVCSMSKYIKHLSDNCVVYWMKLIACL